MLALLSLAGPAYAENGAGRWVRTMMCDFDLSGVPRRVGGDDKEEVRKVQRFAELKLVWRMWGVPTSERLVVTVSRDELSILDADDSCLVPREN